MDKLLRLQFPALRDSDSVTFISADTYVASMSFREVVQSQAYLGFEIDGRKGSWKQGFPGLIFPPTASTQEFHSDPSWWSWWVSAVVQGEPKISLRVNRADIKLAECNENYTRIVPYPRGRRKFKGWKDKRAKISYCSLQKLVSGSRVTGIKNMLGKVQQISASENDLLLVHAVNNEPIPVSMGGPYQVCKKLDAAECVYFVSEIQTVEEKFK